MIFTAPSDVGFACISRRRAFTVFLRPDAGRWIMDPQCVYDLLCSGLSDSQLTIEELLSVGSESDVQEEIDRMRRARGTDSGLTSTEQKNMNRYFRMLDAKGVPPELQIAASNQNPDARFKTCRFGILPAFTATDKYLWIRSRNGPLLAREKFCGHGFPVDSTMADALKIPATQAANILFPMLHFYLLGY